MLLYDWLLAPFVEFSFMRRALAGCIALSFSAAPIGVFMMLRRMSLMGDAIAHAILPGVAVGFLLFGLEILPMSIGGMIAGLVVALAAGLVARGTALKEDASLAAFYLISLSLGVLIVSLKGSSVDLMHVLFGTVLALNDEALIVLGASATITIGGLAVILRPLIAEFVDPGFLAAVRGPGALAYLVFLMLVVSNLVAGFQALGTLLAVGHHGTAGGCSAVLATAAQRHDRRGDRGCDAGLRRGTADLLSLALGVGAVHHAFGRGDLSWLFAGRTGGRGHLAMAAAQASRGLKGVK